MNARKPLIGIPAPARDDVQDSSETVYGVKVAYARRVMDAGGLPVLLPVAPGEIAEAVMSRLDGLLLPGGGDVDPALFGEEPHPDLGTVNRALDDFEIALVRAAGELDRPILGICRGAQVLNVARGGTLVQHIPAQIPGAMNHAGNRHDDIAHTVSVIAASRMAAILGPGIHGVNSTHHQSVKDVAPGLRVSGTCPDDGVVEAIEDPDACFCLSVQFHPEDLGDAFSPLFTAFVAACVPAG